MNISKNTEKKSRKIKDKQCRQLPPIDSMDTWGAPVPNFIEKRTWNLKFLFIIGLLLGLIVYGLREKISFPSKQKFIAENSSVQPVKTETVQLNLDTDCMATEIADYNVNPQQAYLKIDPEVLPVLSEKAEESSEEMDPQDTLAVTSQQIRTWLHQQHIQGVAYKDFESCIVVNGRIFHLNEVIAPELNLVWSDIDPVSKKLFFYDANGTLYFVNY